MKLRKVYTLFIVFIIAYLVIIYNKEGFTGVDISKLYNSSGVALSASTSSTYTSTSATIGDNVVFNGLNNKSPTPSTPAESNAVTTSADTSNKSDGGCCTIS